MSTNGVVTLPPQAPTLSALPPFGVNEIRKRSNALKEVMRSIMVEGTHYGTLPGTSTKPSLWKSGAEVLCMTFRLAPLLESRVTVDDPEAEWNYQGQRRDGTQTVGTCTGFFEIEAICTIHGPNGDILSRCSARCNNRESKYRSLGLFDIRNTILKLAEKRAFVSAALMATGASDIFTQDLEDTPEVVVAVSKPRAVVTAPPMPVRDSGRPSGLTPKRLEWAKRAASEAGMSAPDIEVLIQRLAGASGAELKAFFDGLAAKRIVLPVAS